MGGVGRYYTTNPTFFKGTEQRTRPKTEDFPHTEGVNACLSLCVSPAAGWQPV